MARDITVTFDDGSQHVYANAPDDVSPADVQARAQKDFGKSVTALDGGRAPAAAAPRTGFAAVPTEAEAKGQPYQPDTSAPAPQPSLPEKIEAGTRAAYDTGAGLVGSAVGMVTGAGQAVAENLGLAEPSGTPDTVPAIAPPVGVESPKDAAARRAANAAAVAKAKTAPKVPISLDEAMARRSQGASQALSDIPIDSAPSDLSQEYQEKYVAPVMDTAMAAVPLHGTIPAVGLGEVADAARTGLSSVKQATRAAASDLVNAGADGVTRAAGRAAAEAPAPAPAAPAGMTDAQFRDASTGVNADIPLAPHQLSPNRFLRMLGEASEVAPFTGGDAVRATRQQRFSGALAKVIDPDTDAKVLDSTAFAQMQDTAGQTIGDISGRTDIPLTDFGDIARAARHQDPAIRSVIDAYALDLKEVADQNGGIVPGSTLRELRTRAQTQARGARATKGDLSDALDTLVHGFDETLSNNAADSDMQTLLAARRQYAITKTLEPLVAKYPDGDFPPSALKAVITRDFAGKNRMAKGKAGQLGDYAMLGQNLLKDQGSSGSAERGAVIAAATHPGIAAKMLATLGVGRAYNAFGPGIVKRMVAIERARRAAEVAARQPGEFNPGTSQGFEDNSSGFPPKANPLGDLTPDWQTQPGAGGAPVPDGIDPAGLHPAVGDEPPLPQGMPAAPPGSEIPLARPAPLGDTAPDWETTPGAGGAPRAPGIEPEGLTPAVGDAAVTTGPARDLRNREQIPAVEGRPDLPDTIQVGRPAEAAGTDAANTALGTPGAQEAMRQQNASAGTAAPIDPRLQEVQRLRQGETSPMVLKALDEHEKALKQRIATEQGDSQRRVDAANLRRAATQTPDIGLRQILNDRATRLEQQSAVRAIAAFKDLAKRAGMEDDVIDATVKSTKGMEPDTVGPFLTRATRELERRNLTTKPVPPEDIHALTVDASIKLPEEPKPAKPATEGAKSGTKGVPRETAAVPDDSDTPIARAAREAATHPENDRPEPTQAQKEAENYKIGRDTETIPGEQLSVENGAGSTRRGTSPDGKDWATPMKAHYGRILRTVGMDSTEAKHQHVDFFVKAGTKAGHEGPVFVVDQVDPKTGAPDEHKVMFGYPSIDEAKAGYLEHYEPGWKGLGAITETSLEDFQKWVHSDATAKPFAAIAKKTGPSAEASAGAAEPVGGRGREKGPGPGRAEAEPAAPKLRNLPDKEAFADDYKALEGRDLKQTVQLSDSGKEATLTIDAAKAMRGMDKRLSDIEALKACLRGG